MMSERIVAARVGLVVALTYTLPLLLWLLWQASLSSAGQFDPAPSLRGMVTTLLLLQCCALALCTPWLMRFPAPLDRCSAVAMLLLVPGPLYAITGLAAAVSGTAMLLAILLLSGFALGFFILYAACLGLTAPGNARSILLTCVQVLLLVLCWQYRDLWQQVVST